jgi:hypothetical protein
VARAQRKEPGWEHLFEVPGVEWEDQTEGLKAIHVTIKGSKHIVVYAYHRSSEFNVTTYIEGQYSNASNEQWMGPMEALCVILEALKDASSTLQTSKLGT